MANRPGRFMSCAVKVFGFSRRKSKGEAEGRTWTYYLMRILIGPIVIKPSDS